MRSLKINNQEVIKLPNFMFSLKLLNKEIKLSKSLIYIKNHVRVVKRDLKKCFMVAK